MSTGTGKRIHHNIRQKHVLNEWLQKNVAKLKLENYNLVGAAKLASRDLEKEFKDESGHIVPILASHIERAREATGTTWVIRSVEIQTDAQVKGSKALSVVSQLSQLVANIDKRVEVLEKKGNV